MLLAPVDSHQLLSGKMGIKEKEIVLKLNFIRTKGGAKYVSLLFFTLKQTFRNCCTFASMRKGMIYIRLWLLASILCLSTALSAKKSRGLTVYGTYSVKGSNVSGTNIRLLRNGVQESGSIQSNGKFQYNLKFNNQYVLEFSKPGYITKKVVISTDVPERVLEKNNDFPPFKIAVELFRRVEGGDYSLFDDPVALIIYDKELDDFDFDKAYNAEIEEEIKAIEAKIAQSPVKQIDESTRQYERLVQKADAEFDAKSYTTARENYENALSIKPKESYPKIRIELINRILLKIKKEKEAQEKDKSYYALIDKADILLEEKKYSKARSYYVEATEIKPKQQYPKDKIKLIDQIFTQRKVEQQKYDDLIAEAERNFKRKSYEAAKSNYERALEVRSYESYPKEKIAEINRLLANLKSQQEKNELYEELVTKADAFYTDKNWYDALDAYAQATNIRPDEIYPKKQIEKIENQIRAEKIERQEAEKQAIIAKQRQDYEEAIATADKEFSTKNYSFARHYYQQALSILPDEQYPKNQLNNIKKKIAEKIKREEAHYKKIQASADTTRGKYYKRIAPTAKNEYREVKRIDATQVNQKKYDALLQKAAEAEANGNYAFAKAYYQQAFLLKPSMELIGRINKMMSKAKKTN